MSLYLEHSKIENTKLKFRDLEKLIITGGARKKEALTIFIELEDEDILYHGTSEKNLNDIITEGLCTQKQKIYDISEEGIYLSSDKKEARFWAELSSRANKDKAVILSIKGKDINRSGCILHPDWNVGTDGKLSSFILIVCGRIHIKGVEEIWQPEPEKETEIDPQMKAIIDRLKNSPVVQNEVRVIHIYKA